MLPCRRRPTAVSSLPTLDRLVAACIVSFVLVTVCSCDVAQEVVDIAPEDVSRYYPNVSLSEKGKYIFEPREEPITLLLRTEPESKFEAEVWSQTCGNELYLANGWDTGSGLRFECAPQDRRTKTYTVDEMNGSESFSQLTQVAVIYDGYAFSVKQANGTKLQWCGDRKRQPVSVKDCLFEPKSLGGRLVYALTFVSTIRTRSRFGTFDVYWKPETTVFVRLEEPTTTTTEEPTTTPQATDPVETESPTSSSPETTTAGTTATMKSIQKQSSKPTVNTPAPPSNRTPSNVNDTMPSDSSAAGGLQLGALVAAVVVMQLLVAVFLRA